MKVITKFAIFSAAILLFSCSGGHKTVSPIKKDLVQAVYASGKVFPIGYYKLQAKYPGYVKAIYVKPGDLIKKGDTLIAIRNDQADFAAESAKNLMNLAQKNAGSNSDYISIYQNDLNAAATKLKLDSLNFIRYSQLLKENATTQLQFDQAKVQYEISKANYHKATDALSNISDKANLDAQNARINYETQLSSKNDFVIIAEQSGKIFNVDVKIGELVNQQRMLMEIGKPERFEVELNIDETDVELVKAGQKIIYEADAFKNNEKFEGEVVENYLSINPINKTAKVLATISFNGAQQVYAGMSVEANIIIEKRSIVMVIPREYVFDFNKVKVKGKEELVTIKKGIEDLEFVEVKEGLTESDVLENPVK
ncbi:MAG: efflux RND transporter periplasmic adaptor subunit [Bacteroidia bacterium]|nr:efflux RND transporter periplasmic adaptor subunit [Bacteroidia bacterium]